VVAQCPLRRAYRLVLQGEISGSPGYEAGDRLGSPHLPQDISGSPHATPKTRPTYADIPATESAPREGSPKSPAQSEGGHTGNPDLAL
jgi:hypothetical protein